MDDVTVRALQSLALCHSIWGGGGVGEIFDSSIEPNSEIYAYPPEFSMVVLRTRGRPSQLFRILALVERSLDHR